MCLHDKIYDWTQEAGTVFTIRSLSSAVLPELDVKDKLTFIIDYKLCFTTQKRSDGCNKATWPVFDIFWGTYKASINNTDAYTYSCLGLALNKLNCIVWLTNPSHFVWKTYSCDTYDVGCYCSKKLNWWFHWQMIKHVKKSRNVQTILSL